MTRPEGGVVTDRTPTPEQWREKACAALRTRYPEGDPDLSLMLAMVDELATDAEGDTLVLTRRLHRRLQRLERRYR